MEYPDVTTERVDNGIPGGSSKKGSTAYGYADIICWECTPAR